MQGDRQDQNEYTIERGRERDAGAGRSSPRTASSAPHGERQSGQPQFDLGGETGRQSESGIPERLRRKYYVAEAGAGDEAKVYADPRGEYLAFKASTDRMATRLEDAGVVRDMVSVAQHRGWKEVEVRGSEEFRRTAWLEASVRGLSVRGYEPDPVDRAALAFRAKPETRSNTTPHNPQAREAGASETVTIDGVATKRSIDVTVMPPERSREPQQATAESGAPTSRRAAFHQAFNQGDPRDREGPIGKPTVTIDAAPLQTAASEQSSSKTRRRADSFRSTAHPQHETDDVVRAAHSQLVAIERALSKAVPDPALRRSILAHARNRIAEHLEKGGEFKHAELRERTAHRKVSSRGKSEPRDRNPSRTHEVRRER